MKRYFVNQYGVGIVGGLVGLLCLSVLGLSGGGVHAETTSANASVTVAEACTMTATVNSAHSATINPGQYLQPIGETVLKVICNDAGGYAIYAVGNANNEYGNNKLLANVGGSLNSTYDIATGTATSGSTSNWAMKVSAVSGTYAPTIQNSFGSYHDVPTTYTKVAQLNSMTDATTGSSVSTTYAAYVKSDQPAGNYNGKVKYTMVHPTTETPLSPQTASSNCINYFPNGSNVVGTMGCQSVGASATSATLLASNYSRTGYGFAGWSDSYDYATNPNAKFYGPNETITFTAGQYRSPNSGLALYAVWVKSAGSLQDSSTIATLCGTGTGSLTQATIDGTANLASVSALTDQRDNQTYAIAKLSDGKCWMIENLRLENTNNDNATGNLAQGYGTSTTYGNFSGLADPETTNFTSTTTANSLYYSGIPDGTATVNIGTTNSPSSRFPRYNHENTNSRASSPTSNGTAIYSYGNYYTWHAAVADLSYNSTLNGSVTNTSLCPTGWRLPQGGNKTRIESNDDNDFWNLTVDALNGGTNPANYDSSTFPYYENTAEAGPVSKKLRSYPNNFLYSGSFTTSSAGDRGSYGYYRSSTSNSSNSYLLSLTSSQVFPGTNSLDKVFGYSIRCVAGS